MPCLEVENAAPEASPLVDATFLDGAAVVQMLNPGTAKTFLDYAEQVLYPMYQYSSKIPLVLTLFGMFIKQIASMIQQDKRGAKVYGEELFPLQRFQRTGRISSVGTTTIHNCLASRHTRSVFYRKRAKQCTQLMAMMCFALWHKLT